MSHFPRHLLRALPLEGHDTRPRAGLKTPKTMESRNIKVKKATFLLLLLCSSVVAKQSIPDCCRQKSCSCRVFELLHGMGNHAAGILTLGKRSGATTAKAFQSRLYQLLHSSDNQAAGILTMGKRVSGLVSEHEEVPSIQLTPVPYARRPDPTRGCQAPLDKDLPTIQKTGAANAVY